MIDRMTRRRIFIGAAASIVSVPAIVRAASLMPVRGLLLPVERPLRLNPYGEHCRRFAGWSRRRAPMDGCHRTFPASKTIKRPRYRTIKTALKRRRLWQP